MNQILSVNMPNRNKQNGKKVGIKPIIIFFCIILVIFGIAMIAIGFLSKPNNITVDNRNNNTVSDNTEDNKPRIDITESVDKLNVRISSENGIEKVVYKWNNEDETPINIYDENTYTFDIDKKIGVNILTLTATDKKGAVQEIKREYEGKEKYSPTFNLSQKSNTLIVKCTSDKVIDYISYFYDQEEEKRQSINNQTGEIEVDIREGEHNLTIKVVNLEGETSTEEKKIYIPTADIKVTQDRQRFIVNAEDSRKITKIRINLNGEQIERNVDNNKYTEEFNLKDGYNAIMIMVTNSDGLSIIKGVSWNKE